MNNVQEVKVNRVRLKGIFISYCVTFVNLLANLLLVPLYLNKFGIDLYGLYQYIYSLAQYAVILDFGIASVMTKFLREFDLRGDETSKENIAFYSIINVLISFLLIVIVAFVMIINLNVWLLNGRPVEQQLLARLLLGFMAFQFGLVLLLNYFDGALIAFEDYFIVKLFALIRILLKIILILVLVFLDIGIMSIILGDVIATLACVCLSAYRTFVVKRLRIKFHYWDRTLFLESVLLSYALFLQSVVTFANNYVDKILLGKMLNNSSVTLYSLAMTFNGLFCEIPTVIQRLYLPESVKLITKGASGEELTDYVARIGRFQFMLCGAIIAMFLLFGKEFIQLWSGKETLLSWSIAIILMFSSLIPIIQNVCLTILTAMNKRAFRSYMLLIGVIVNILITIPLIQRYGVLGAPVGTVISSLIFNWVVMNIYYTRVIHLNIIRMFKIIIPKISVVLLLSTVLCIPFNLFFSEIKWSTFIFKCTCFCFIYLSFLMKFGINKPEREYIKGVLFRERKQVSL